MAAASMFVIDHVAIWTPERDVVLAALSAATGLPILDGFAPAGRATARGVAFADGVFLDVHLAPTAGGPLLGLRGPIAAAETLAAEHGWKVKVIPRQAHPDAEPWTVAAFRKGQGLLSQIFVIAYSDEPKAWTSPIFNGGLYRARGSDDGPRLCHVRLGTQDLQHSRAMLAPFGLGPDRLEVYEAAEGEMTLVFAGGAHRRELQIGPQLRVEILPQRQEG